MSSSPDEFEFKKNVEFPSVQVRVILNKIANLPEDIQVDSQGELSAENKLSVEAMSESEMAQYLQEFVNKYPGVITVQDLHAHTMFQAVLARAHEITDHRD